MGYVKPGGGKLPQKMLLGTPLADAFRISGLYIYKVFRKKEKKKKQKKNTKKQSKSNWSHKLVSWK